MKFSEKIEFLRVKLIPLLLTLQPEQKGEWGLMNAQQMVEHLSDSFRNYYGFDSKKIITAPEHLPKLKEFLMSDKPFRQNQRNVLMPEIPAPVKCDDMNASIECLKTDILNFFKYFELNPDVQITNVIFGELNFAECVQLLYKHCTHHLKQFGIGEGV